MAPDPVLDQARPDFFRALGDANRLAIVANLAACGGETRTVSEVATCCPLDLSTVSRHLSILKAAGLVTAERRGREVHYRCCCDEVAATLRALADAIDCHCLPQSSSPRSPVSPRGDGEATAPPPSKPKTENPTDKEVP